MHPQLIPAIPEETARIAHAVLPKGNVWMRMREELGKLYEDEDFADLFPSRGLGAQAPCRQKVGKKPGWSVLSQLQLIKSGSLTVL